MSEEFKSFFNDVSDGNESRRCNYTVRLDTYGRGCRHDCRYCYAKSLLSFRGMWNPANPAVADIAEIRKTIKKELHPGMVVRLGGMTDCFQPAEREHRVTLATIKALNEAGVGYLIVTKKKLLARVKGFRELTVCEDVYGHWKYWKEKVNANPDDCCNLKGVKLIKR